MSLNFSFTKEQEELRARVQKVAETYVTPGLKEWDEKEEMPWPALNAFGQAGLMGIIGKKEFGGLELDYISLGIVIETLARTDTTTAMMCSVQNTLTTLTPGWDADDIREVYKGNKLVCIATSEEDAGSDVSNISTSAVIDGTDYIINGVKIHVSLMPGASVMGVSVNVPASDGETRIEFIKVPSDSPGVTCELMPEMGMRAHQLARVFFKDVRVPIDSALGKERGNIKDGKALMYARWNVTRCLSALNAIGSALQVLDETVEFVKKKEVYGRKIGLNQAVSFPIVEHYTRLEACRLLAYQGLWKNVRGEDAAREATMSKWHGVTEAIDAIGDCLQMYGAAGYLKDLDVERRLRDVMGLAFTGGTINVMKLVVVGKVLGKEYMGLSRK